jgi:hypothetical protein
MAERLKAEDSDAPPAPEGPPPSDEEALATVLETFPGATVQETVHRNG